MTNSETIKANFPFPIIPREPGLPTFQIVNDVHNKSKANAASILSSLGGGAHGLLGLGLSPAITIRSQGLILSGPPIRALSPKTSTELQW